MAVERRQAFNLLHHPDEPLPLHTSRNASIFEFTMRLPLQPALTDIVETSKPTPNGLDARFPVTFPAEESTQLRDHSYPFPHCRRLQRKKFRGIYLGAKRLPLEVFQYHRARGIWRLPSLIGQPQQTPSDDRIGGNGTLHGLDRFQQRVLDLAAAFRHEMITLPPPRTRGSVQ